MANMEGKLIEAIRAHPCLYNKSCHHFRNKFLKEKAWKTVASAVGAPEKYCQTRWKSLRDRFVKERAALKSKSGAAAEDENKWQYMDAMSFLTDHVAPRKTVSNMDFNWPEEQETDNNTNFDESDSVSSQLPSTSPCSPIPSTPLRSPLFESNEQPSSSNTRKRRRMEEEANERFGALCTTVTKFIESKSDSFKNSRNIAFYKVLDDYLNKHSEEAQDTLKMEILNFVFNYKDV